MQNSYAAKGLAQSGAAMKGAGEYAKGLADTTYQSIVGNYFNALSLGEQAAAQTGEFGANLQAQSNAAGPSAAAARASGVIGSANAYAQGLGNLGNSLLLPAQLHMAGLYN